MSEAPSRILVVDDDATVSEVVARYLERDGYVVETVGDGREALDRALAEPPDLGSAEAWASMPSALLLVGGGDAGSFSYPRTIGEPPDTTPLRGGFAD